MNKLRKSKQISNLDDFTSNKLTLRSCSRKEEILNIFLQRRSKIYRNFNADGDINDKINENN